jgi:hypothetical protein
MRVPITENLAHFAGLAYGDGYPVWGEVRVVTSNPEFALKLREIVRDIARDFNATWREYVRPGNISSKQQHTVVLNSTLVRRALFDDRMKPDYDAIYSLAMDSELSGEFQAGFTDAEGSILDPVPVDSPHGRVFAAVNNDRRLLGITRLSLVSVLRLEPSSLRIRLAGPRGRRHVTHGLEFIARRNSYRMEVLSGAKKKWLQKIGTRLWHPSKSVAARTLLLTYENQEGNTRIALPRQ